MKKIILILLIFFNITFANSDYFVINSKKLEKLGELVYSKCSKNINFDFYLNFILEIGFDNKKLSYYNIKIKKSDDYSSKTLILINDLSFCFIDFFSTNEDFKKEVLTFQKSYLSYEILLMNEK